VVAVTAALAGMASRWATVALATAVLAAALVEAMAVIAGYTDMAADSMDGVGVGPITIAITTAIAAPTLILGARSYMAAGSRPPLRGQETLWSGSAGLDFREKGNLRSCFPATSLHAVQGC
jgi:hypothetical protein